MAPKKKAAPKKSTPPPTSPRDRTPAKNSEAGYTAGKKLTQSESKAMSKGSERGVYLDERPGRQKRGVVDRLPSGKPVMGFTGPTGFGTTAPRKNSSSRGGMSTPKKKAPKKGSKY